MLPPRVMSRFPLGINDWAFADLDDAVAGAKPRFSRSFYEIYVRPIVAMMMDVVCEFAEQNALRLKDAISFGHKRWVRVSKGILIFLR